MNSKLPFVFALAAFTCVMGASDDAAAQYRNLAFGMNAGPGFIIPNNNVEWFREFTVTSNGGTLPTGETAPRGSPFGLVTPVLSLDFAFKISLENWFLKTGLNLGLWSVVRDTAFDARLQGGFAIQIEGMFGPRAYFLTDNVRPYFEFGVRLNGMVYTTQVGQVLPTNFRVMPGVYGALGLEIIVMRDVAINFAARYTRYLILNFYGLNMIEGMSGVVLYL